MVKEGGKVTVIQEYAVNYDPYAEKRVLQRPAFVLPAAGLTGFGIGIHSGSLLKTTNKLVTLLRSFPTYHGG
jgi:hypothetical protein